MDHPTDLTLTASDQMSPLGKLERAGDGWMLRFVRDIPHAPERVWRALIEPAELAAWFPTTIDGDRRAGSLLTFRFRENQAPEFHGELTAYEPPRLLEFWWGPDRLRLELEATGDGTRLTLLDSFTEQGKAARDAAGWHVCLDGLEAALVPDAAQPFTTWNDAHAQYVRTLGPDAATIGPPEGMG